MSTTYHIPVRPWSADADAPHDCVAIVCLKRTGKPVRVSSLINIVENAIHESNDFESVAEMIARRLDLQYSFDSLTLTGEVQGVTMQCTVVSDDIFARGGAGR